MLIIKNATISKGNKNDVRIVNIYIDGEKISKIEDASSEIPKNVDIIDAEGLLVLPGAIDPHVHFNTPGYERREDFEHGTKAAAAGGVTTVIDMPDTSIPCVTNSENLDKKLSIIEKQAHVDFALWGGVSKNSMRNEWWHDSMVELWERGVVGFKAYLISGMDSFQDLSIIELGQVMQHANKIGALVGLHAEEKDIVVTRTEELQKKNKNSLQDYYFSRSDPVEKQGAAIGVHLAKQTGCRLHIVHVGSAGAVEVIARGKAMGVDLSAETCPHFLQFTHKDFEKYGSLIKTAPVVKTESDRETLWSSLKQGGIDFVATDHAPCSLKEKKTGSCWTDYNGIPGVEIDLPYMFSEGYMKKRLTLARLIEVTGANAAKRFGLYPNKGSLNEGTDADFVLIDPSKIWKVDQTKLHSKARWSPLHGNTLTGRIIKTYVRGKEVYDFKKGIISKAGHGKWIKRGKKKVPGSRGTR